MPWNNGGPGPRGNASSSNDGNDRPQSPWGNPGGTPGGNPGGGNPNGTPGGRPNDGRPDGERGPRRPNNPFGGGGGPFGGGPFGGGSGGPGNDIDRLIEQAQAFIRGLLGGSGGGGNGRGSGRNGGGGSGGGSWAVLTSSRALAFLGLIVVVIWMGSGFYRVQPDQQGVVLRFGAYSYWTPPGLHWHLPWPIESVLLPTVTRINRTEIGYRSSSGGSMDGSRGTSDRDILAESLMLTGDENIIDIDISVFWRVANASDFLFNTATPEGLVRAVAESSIREVMGRTPIQPALGPLRGQIEQDVLRQTQEILNRYGTGVEITQVQLQKVDPPAAVIESFRDVQRANTDAERMRNEAEAYRNDIVPRARGEAARITAEAQGAKMAAIAQATGEAQRFDSVLKAYQAAKQVTLTRMYLDTMQDVMTRSHPLVVDGNLKGLVPFLPLQIPAAPHVPSPTPALTPAPAAGGAQ
ncbi:FtsH protease activity modulator HflK [Rhodopila sp.]|uniref:FtsH protease activity modulator HflK n=1 Tax=Rhodopila sp. TaxID=2480087 RepID=UPI002C7E67F2|nr:FtsH protease activity modulator HflK [Rhodopila sp.]HVZ08796.1 FtsH protease activity modulator HflK [Rhodopila sp.]